MSAGTARFTLPRSTRDTGSISSCLVSSGSFMLRISSSTAFSPLSDISYFTGIRPGVRYCEISRSSKPMSEMSSGTRTPRS